MEFALELDMHEWLLLRFALLLLAFGIFVAIAFLIDGRRDRRSPTSAGREGDLQRRGGTLSLH